MSKLANLDKLLEELENPKSRKLSGNSKRKSRETRESRETQGSPGRKSQASRKLSGNSKRKSRETRGSRGSSGSTKRKSSGTREIEQKILGSLGKESRPKPKNPEKFLNPRDVSRPKPRNASQFRNKKKSYEKTTDPVVKQCAVLLNKKFDISMSDGLRWAYKNKNAYSECQNLPHVADECKKYMKRNGFSDNDIRQYIVRVVERGSNTKQILEECKVLVTESIQRKRQFPTKVPKIRIVEKKPRSRSSPRLPPVFDAKRTVARSEQFLRKSSKRISKRKASPSNCKTKKIKDCKAPCVVQETTTKGWFGRNKKVQQCMLPQMI